MTEDHRDLVVEEYSWFRIFLLIFILTAVIGFFGFNYFSNKPLILLIKKEDKSVKKEMPSSPEPTKSHSLSPTPTIKETLKLNRQDLKIQVLNGSQIAGIAKKTKIMLEKLGYQKIDIGNAENSDSKETEISLKNDKKDYFDLLRNDLKGSYKISSQAGELKQGSDYDAVVILGSL